MTKKKHYIKTVKDIKYCEENGLTIFSEIEDRYYEFHNGVWCSYDENYGDIKIYNCEICVDDLDLYYYEEEPEERKEATEKDVGKLCWFYTDDDDNDRDIGILTGMQYKKGDSRHYKMDNIYYYKHCRRLSPAEVAEITGYTVEEAE